jgi:hypothetical protein
MYRLTAVLTTSTPDSPPSGAISQAEQCQASHGMPQPPRFWLRARLSSMAMVTAVLFPASCLLPNMRQFF